MLPVERAAGSPRITAEVYQQGNTTAKRSALNKVSGIFVVQAKAS
jgi:hypothetical protein